LFFFGFLKKKEFDHPQNGLFWRILFYIFAFVFSKENFPSPPPFGTRKKKK
tara:strand:- start:1105 stop:1257 length:153 start_codon:yes stop_codon:yes gene_type:complete